jgi:hypothetical protein
VHLFHAFSLAHSLIIPGSKDPLDPSARQFLIAGRCRSSGARSVGERKWDQGGKTSDHDTPPLPCYLPPLGLHALPQGERKHLLHPAACLRGALDILGTDFTCDLCALFGRDGCLTLCTEQVSHVIVSTKIRFGCNEDEQRSWMQGCYLNSGQKGEQQ